MKCKQTLTTTLQGENMIGKLGDLANLMKNAQSIQDNMEAAKQEMENKTVTGESGAGMVQITMNGKHSVLKTTISPELLSEDPEVISELFSAAVNDASRKVNELAKDMMSQFGGLLGDIAG
jgi:nucleoid-associated protein EbfC